MIKAAKTPINETEEMEINAGCFAKIKAPIPKIVVIAAKIIEVR